MRSTRGLSSLKVLIEVSNSCNVCGLCAEYCPTGVFRVVGTHLSVNQGECIYCKGCEVVCPVKAISVRALNDDFLILKRKTLISVK
ncbi:MAG: 4Fe-4S binding protein [Sulfolobales archaeon]